MTDIKIPVHPTPQRRERLTREKAAELIKQASEQRMSLAAFARSVGLNENTLYAWRDKLRGKIAKQKPKTLAPLMRINHALPSSPVPTLIFPSGLRFENPHLIPATDLQRLVQSLSC